MLVKSIPAIRYHMALIPLFCLLLSGCLRQVLLYVPLIVLHAFFVTDNFFFY